MVINTPFSISEMVFLAEALRAGQATKPLANAVLVKLKEKVRDGK